MKVLPEKLTKAFFFEKYGNQHNEKSIRLFLHYFFDLLGFNKRQRNIPDIIVIYFMIKHGLPSGYETNEKIKIQLKRINKEL